MSPVIDGIRGRAKTFKGLGLPLDFIEYRVLVYDLKVFYEFIGAFSSII